MKKVGIAIIGTGAIAPAHLKGYLMFPDLCEIKALCDIYPEKAQKLAKEYSLEVLITSDYTALLDRDDIDAVSICLPPYLHSQVSIACLKAGKNVLCEKPMAASLEECDQMISAQEESGKLLSIVSQNRFRTPMMKMKTLLDSGIAGKINYIAVNSLWWRGPSYYDLWWRGTWEHESGGCTINHAVHQIDILQWLIGIPQSITSVMANVAHPNSECEDLSLSILKYPKMLAEVNASIVNHDGQQEFVFQTEKARLSIPWVLAAVKAKNNGFPEPNTEVENTIQKAYEALPSLSVEAHPAQIQNFLKAILNREKLFIDGVEGRKVIELISAIYKSASLHVNVTLPLDSSDIFYHKDTMIQAVPKFHKKTKSIENFESNEISLGSNIAGEK